MRYLPILEELFESDTIFFLLIGTVFFAFVGKRMQTIRQKCNGMLACLFVYAICEILSNICTNYLIEIVLLFVGNIAIGGVIGFLIGLVVSKIRKQK